MWLLVALAVLKHSLDITWRQYAKVLQTPQATAVLKQYGAIKPPSKSTLHKAWDNAPIGPLRDTLIEIGWKIAQEPKSLAIDSTGFEMKAGSTWRLLKWDRSFLKKASKWFDKAHILVDTASQAVLSISFTESFDHDLTQVLRLLRRARVLRRKREYVLYGDKAYHDKQLHAKLLEWGVKFVVESKKNFVLRGVKGFLERSLRLYKNSPGLWRHTFRYWRKAAVEHVFGLVKQHKPSLMARELKNKHKELLTAFLLYDLKTLLKKAQNGGK